MNCYRETKSVRRLCRNSWSTSLLLVTEMMVQRQSTAQYTFECCRSVRILDIRSRITLLLVSLLASLAEVTVPFQGQGSRSMVLVYSSRAMLTPVCALYLLPEQGNKEARETLSKPQGKFINHFLEIIADYSNS